jgi:glycosyltransferase involved in cell wall biosynthesis
MNEYISIIIPIYNKEEYISETLNSVLSQTYKKFEIIVIDDGSTDLTAKIIKEFYNQSVNYIYQENRGVSSARNKGISLAKYDLIAFLDADDLWQTNYLESIVLLHNNYPKVSVYATSYKFKEESGKLKNAKFSIRTSNEWNGVISNYFSASLKDPLITSSSVVIHKKVFKRLGVFMVGKVLAEDLDMWARIALFYDIAFEMSPLVIYRRDISNNVKKTVVIKEDYIVITHLEKMIVDNNIKGFKLFYIRRYLSVYCDKCATRYYQAKQNQNANRMLNKAIKYSVISVMPKILIKLLVKKVIYNITRS